MPPDYKGNGVFKSLGNLTVNARVGLLFIADEFIWRETGSRHVPWCLEGGLMLAIFHDRCGVFSTAPNSSPV